jgi:hypothetical protein
MAIKRSFVFVAAALCMLLLLPACGQSENEQQPATTVAPITTQAATRVIPQTPEMIADTADVSAGDGTRSDPPADFGAMVAGLGSHEVVVNAAFSGQDAVGGPVSFSWQRADTVTRNPAGYRLDLSSSGDDTLNAVQAMTLVQLAAESYLYLPSVGCLTGVGEDFDAGKDSILEPARLLAGLSLAEPVAEGVVLGDVRVAEYHFDGSALDQFSTGPWSLEGVAYVTEDSNLMTRVSLTISGQGDLLGDGQVLDGTFQITVDVNEIDEGAPLEVPAACRQAWPYPVTADAFEISSIDDLLAFKSLMPIDDIVDFYRTQMPAADWLPAGEPEVFGDLAFFSYTRNSQQVLITIETDPETGATNVLISP